MKINPKLENFINEEVKKFKKIKFLEQRLKVVEKELEVLNEGDVKKMAQWYFNKYNGDYNKIRRAALNNIVNSEYQRFSNDYVTNFWQEIKKLEQKKETENTPLKENKTLTQLKEECRVLEQKLFKN